MSLLVRCDGGCGATVELEADRYGSPRRMFPPGWYAVTVWQGRPADLIGLAIRRARAAHRPTP